MSRSKTVVIYQNLNTARSWNLAINLSFDPDKVIVRQICYKQGAETAIYCVKSSLTGDYLGTFQDGTSADPKTTFSLSGTVNSTYSFEVHETPGTVSTTAAGKLCIILEFVKN